MRIEKHGRSAHRDSGSRPPPHTPRPPTYPNEADPQALALRPRTSESRSAPLKRYTSSTIKTTRGKVATNAGTGSRAGSRQQAGSPVHRRRPAGLAATRRLPAPPYLRHLLPLHRIPHRRRRPYPGRLPQALQEPLQLRHPQGQFPDLDHAPSPAISSSTTSAAPASTAPPSPWTPPSATTRTAPSLADRLADPGLPRSTTSPASNSKSKFRLRLSNYLPSFAKRLSFVTWRTWIIKKSAQVLRIPEGTVKSRISRGRGELARLLQRIEGQVI